MNNNLIVETRVNKNGLAVRKHVLPPSAPTASKVSIPAPLAAPKEKPSSFTFSKDDMKELGEIIATSTEDERSYFYLFLEKGDLDGIKIMHAYAHEPSISYDIMNTLEDLGLSSPEESIEVRQAKINRHAPFYEAGLIDYAAYGAEDNRNEELVKVVEEYAGHSIRVFEVMSERDLQLAEELRPVLASMDGLTPPLRNGAL
jgi:hypothetical protein